MKKLLLFINVLIFCLVVEAQTDISTIDPVKKGNLCLAMLKGGGVDTTAAKSSKPVSVNGLQFSAVNYDQKTGHASPVAYTAQAGDQGLMTKDSIVWAVIHGSQQYLVTPKKITLASVQSGGQQSSSVDANAIMAYLQQKTDSLLQMQNQQIQQQASTIALLQKKIKKYKNGGGNNNQQNYSDPNSLYAQCFTRPDPRTRYGGSWNNPDR